MQIVKQILLLIAVVALVGCGATGATGISRKVSLNNANMARLSIGMKKAEVLAIMGLAGRTEAYQSKTGGGGSHHEFLFYRTEVTRVHPIGGEELGTVTDRHWTPVCIIDGKVKGWGRNFYDDTIKIRKEIIRK